jgi:hypothetical protein
LRPCLKRAKGTIPEILPEIYVRTRKLHVSSERKGRSKTRLASSTSRAAEGHGKQRTTLRRAKSASSTVDHSRQLQKRSRSASLPKFQQEHPREETRKESPDNRETNVTSLVARTYLANELRLSREAVIARLIHGAFPRCPRPAHLELEDGLTDATSLSATTNMASVVETNPISQSEIPSSP